jgi:hypothetical protein
LMTAILTIVAWNFTVVWICILFMAEDVEHFFMYLFNICPSFQNYLFNLFTHILIGLLVFWCSAFELDLILYLINSHQILSPILWVVPWFWELFPLLCAEDF